jgi:hypothetical protein
MRVNHNYACLCWAGRGVCSAIAMKRPFQSSLYSSSPNSTSKGLLANPIPNLPTNHIPIKIPSTDINSLGIPFYAFL